MSKESDKAFTEWWETTGRKHTKLSIDDSLLIWDAALEWSRPIAARAIKDAKAGHKKGAKDVHFQGKRLLIDQELHEASLVAWEGIDLECEYRKMDAWLVSNKRNYKAFGRFANTWLSRVKIPMNGKGNRYVTVESKEPTADEWRMDVMDSMKRLIDGGTSLTKLKDLTDICTPSMLAEIKQYAETKR